MSDKLELKSYAFSVNQKIDIFHNENNTVFHYPRSNIYTSGIYDSDNKPIFTLLKNLPDFYSEFYEDFEQICYKQFLKKNLFKAHYIVTCKEKNNSKVIYNVLILLVSVISLLFLSSFILIKQSIEPYKKINQYLDNFIKDAMHELKTPLGVAHLNIDMLQEKIGREKHITRIKSAIKNMSIIYEDLEFYMRQHVLKDHKKEINFSSFLSKRVDFFADLACVKEIAICTKIDAGILLYFDETELSRIIDNNLSNAIKYSKNGSEICISLEKTKEAIILTFKDEGIGIADTSKIFDRYYRGDKISGGFGIGLSIVKKICDKNGISIHVASAHKQGSCFTYTFKL